MPNVAISGGFDPFHEGHAALIEDARKHGDVIVILNSDDWLRRKKGFCFLPWESRARILRLMGCRVEPVDDSDGTVCEALHRIAHTCAFFANGGDRNAKNTPELDVCEERGIEPLFGIGGTDKPNSSRFIPVRAREERQWGHYEVIAEDDNWKVKRLVINAECSTSKQRHQGRGEVFLCVEGEGSILIENFPACPLTPSCCSRVVKGEWHQITNTGKGPLVLIETQYGDCREDDIERA